MPTRMGSPEAASCAKADVDVIKVMARVLTSARMGSSCAVEKRDGWLEGKSKPANARL
jgi:hypothetical protein